MEREYCDDCGKLLYEDGEEVNPAHSSNCCSRCWDDKEREEEKKKERLQRIEDDYERTQREIDDRYFKR